MGVTVVILADSGGCGLSFHPSLGKTSTGQGDESRNSEIQMGSLKAVLFFNAQNILMILHFLGF